NNYSYPGKGSFKVNNGNWTHFEDCLTQTTLAINLTSSGTSISVVDGTLLPASNFYVTIDNEVIRISSRLGNTLTVAPSWNTFAGNGRGAYGDRDNPTATSHASGAAVSVRSLQMAYGGVGGGFNTLKFSCALPAGTLAIGANTVRLRLNLSLDDSSGYRVVAMNLLDKAGTQLIPSNNFAQEDPATWTAPAGSDVSRGLTAWTTATLLTPTIPGYTSAVHCSDCHAIDGRDLKYFAYSPTSIQVRSLFHGLTQQQADDISAYILSNAASP